MKKGNNHKTEKMRMKHLLNFAIFSWGFICELPKAFKIIFKLKQGLPRHIGFFCSTIECHPLFSPQSNTESRRKNEGRKQATAQTPKIKKEFLCRALLTFPPPLLSSRFSPSFFLSFFQPVSPPPRRPGAGGRLTKCR